MNTAIEAIRELLPPLTEPRPTKIDVLSEASLYFKRVQELSLALIAENKRLKEELALRNSSPQPAHRPTTPSNSSTRREGFRFLMLSLFFVWSAFGFPVGYASFSSGATYDTGRVLFSINSATSEIASAIPGYLSWLITPVIVLAFLSLLVVIWSLQEKRVSSDQLRAAKYEFAQGFGLSSKGRAAQGWKHMEQSLALLGKDIPPSAIGQVFFLSTHVVRGVMASIWIGKWIERAITRLRKRDVQVLELETTIYCGLLKCASSHRHQHSTLLYYCIALAAACSFIPFHASEGLKGRALSSVCMAKAWSLLLRRVLRQKGRDTEGTYRTFIAVVNGREHLSEGRFEDARRQWRVALQEYKGPWFGKRRLLCAAANAYLLEDRYREAAVLFSEAIQSAVLNRDEESVLWASIGVIHCLCRSGDLQAAQQIIHEVDEYLAIQDIVLQDRPYEFVLYNGELAHLRYTMGDYASALKHLKEVFDYIQDCGLPKVFFLLLEFMMAADMIHSMWEKAKEGEASLKDKESELNSLSRRACKSLYLLTILHPFLAVPAARSYAWRLFCLNHQLCAKCYAQKAIKLARQRKLPQEEIRTLEILKRFAPAPASAAEGSARAV